MPINGVHPFVASMTEAHKREFLTKEQNNAYKSGDEKAMSAADEQALQGALQASLKEATKASRAEVHRATGAPVIRVDLHKAQEELTKRAEVHLNQLGLQLVKTRNCAPNCLLVALLQHATGKYAERLTSPLSEKVKQLRAALVRESEERCAKGQRKTAIKTDDRLDANDPLIPWLAKKICGENVCGENVRVDFYCADANGRVVNFHSVGDGPQSVQIFDCGGSFKAIVPAECTWRTWDPEPYV